MPASGWKQLLSDFPWFGGEGQFPLQAYSEYMPPPRLGRKPYGSWCSPEFDEHDPRGFPISEYEEAWQLRPGWEKLAQSLVGAMVHLGQGKRTHGLSKHKLTDNPYWPAKLAERAGQLKHERFVIFLPLALSRTQDDKGRVRWTLFGGSEQGPAKPFWRGFFSGPGKEMPKEQGVEFIRRLLHQVYGQPLDQLNDLYGVGFRILARDRELHFAHWAEGPLPSWTAPFLWSGTGSADRIKYLLTFRPFGSLPAAVQNSYLAGELHLLPFPGSLVFWGAQAYLALQRDLPLAMQISLLHLLDRHGDSHGIRVPQSGWLHEPRDHQPLPALHGRRLRQMYQRTNRWNRTHRHQDELDVLDKEDKVAHVLFSTAHNELGLYDKPMARNAQIWTSDHHLLLDGPKATRADIKRAALHLAEGGLFGYRFLFPAMRLGQHEVYWHRPLVAFWDSKKKCACPITDAPQGYLTAYPETDADLEKPVELWPRFQERAEHLAGLELFNHEPGPHWTAHNIRKILEMAQELGPNPLPPSFARMLLKIAKHETLDDWLNSLPSRANDRERGAWLAQRIRLHIDWPENLTQPYVDPKKPTPTLPLSDTPTLPHSDTPTPPPSSPALPPLAAPLTLQRTARRPFEVAYWNTIAFLAHGQFRNKDNADCVLDKTTQSVLTHHQRDLEALGDYLIEEYQKAIKRAGMAGDAWVGEHAFLWRTEFDFSWWGGWVNNQSGLTHERNIVMRIPGRDSSQAVIMADHYDTAYMEDHFGRQEGKSGPRLAAAGADDNHSATAALLLAAPIFLELSKAGKLKHDIWLVHLTGEEFPADCLGARHLCQDLVQENLQVRVAGSGEIKDLSQVRIKGLYVSDMIAHNNDHDQDVFQIAPGEGPLSARLALEAHRANAAWNQLAQRGNKRSPRRLATRGQRSADGSSLPAVARYPLLHGEVRPAFAPRSALYNTDGQVFSDAGIPCVLFMENYDINRKGYHDSHDNMTNIDLDYGSALAAIVIETVARVASGDD